MDVDSALAAVVPLLQTLIRNGCVNEGTLESGHEGRNADVLTTYLEGGGLDVQRFTPPDAPHRPSLVARIEGHDPSAPTLCLCGHTDVVPVNPEGWSRDPFGGDLVAGEVWGRGAVDMLNQTAAMAVAVRRLADRGWRPRGTLVYLAVADEEAGSLRGVSWLQEAEPAALAVDVVFTEVGGTVSRGADGLRVAVSVAEKGGCVTDIVVRGTPAHGSTPWGADNALITAAEVVRRIAAHRPATHVDDVWRGWVEGQDLEAATKAVLVDEDRLWASLADLPPGLARHAHACTHTTFSPNVVRGGTKRNIIPDAVHLEVDVRVVQGDTAEQVGRDLAAMMADLPTVEVTVVRSGDATVSPQDTPAWAAMQRAVDRVQPGARLLASPLTASTDARFFRRAGVPAYGFGLLSADLSPADYWSRFHGNDERIDVESLRLSVALWEELLVDFLG